MANIIKMSEAASMALHTAVYLAGCKNNPATNGEIANWIGGSAAHLSKVLQRLAKAGLVTSIRGPRGGFVLSRAPEAVTLLQVYEAIEGPLRFTDCLLGVPVCNGNCILGDLLHNVNTQAKTYLEGKTLADFATMFTKGEDHACA
ncbi:MAG: RrF2 family transcriptional regulator [Desulfatibacillaceae bacterium]